MQSMYVLQEISSAGDSQSIISMVALDTGSPNEPKQVLEHVLVRIVSFLHEGCTHWYHSVVPEE